MCSYPYSLSQSPSFCCKGTSFGLPVCVVKFSWWFRSLRNKWAIVHIRSNLLWIPREWCWCLEMTHILERLSTFFGWDDADALTGGIIFIAVLLRTHNRNLQKTPPLNPNPEPQCHDFLRYLCFIELKLCLKEPDSYPWGWVLCVSWKIKLL